jgi:hypothetical protein
METQQETPMERHTYEEQMNGVCRYCTFTSEYVKKCSGFGMIGDRACDTRHRAEYTKGMSYIICKYNGNLKNSSH